MKKLILPIAIMALGVGSAFATQSANAKEKSVQPAYRIDAESGLCVLADQNCNSIGTIVCTWSVDGVTPLHKAPNSPTECGMELFKL